MPRSVLKNRALATITLTFAISFVSRPALASDLDRILQNMRAAGSSIKSLKAQVATQKRSNALGVLSNERGEIFVKRSPKGDSFRANYPGKVVTIDGNRALFYQERIKQAIFVARSSLASQDPDFDFFANFYKLNMASLKARYNISYVGEDRTEAGSASILAFVPKINSGRRIKLWVDETVWLPLRIEISEPDGDVTNFALTNFQKNPAIDDSFFKFRPPPGTEEIHR